eukprot:9472109-Pyramimonas_sp.AAC.1
MMRWRALNRRGPRSRGMRSAGSSNLGRYPLRCMEFRGRPRVARRKGASRKARGTRPPGYKS